MVDPTSDLEENVDEASAPQCDSCGEPIVEEPDHRVVTRIESGIVRHWHFCDEGCRSAWTGPVEKS